MSASGANAGARRFRHRRVGIAAAALAGLIVAGAAFARTIPISSSGSPSAAVDLPEPPATTTRVSVGDDERQSNGASGGANRLINAPGPDQVISADGRWVAFASAATNLVPGTRTPFGGIFLRNRETNSTSAIPWIGGGVFPDNVTAAEPAISADGGVVAFTAIVEGVQIPGAILATKGALPFVLVWDAQTGVTEVASFAPNGDPTPGYQPTVSGDGRYVAYTQWFIPEPDTTPPAVSNVHVTSPGPDQNDGKHYFFGQTAQCTPHQATIQATVTEEESGIASVTLFYQPQGSGVLSLPMTSIGSNVWSVDILNTGWNQGPVAYWVQARDGTGNLSGNVFGSDVLENGSCIT